MVTVYERRRKIAIFSFITVASVILFAVAAVSIYYIVKAIVPEKEKNSNFLFSVSSTATKGGAVASNGYLCAEIGKKILQENGTAVDSAIAVAICEGVMCFQSMGIGGGFLMTIYKKSSESVTVLNARESAPLGAFENMFGGDKKLSEEGGLSVAVPGELKGYYEAYKRFGGGVSWKRLFEPSIKICQEGFGVYEYLASHIQRYRKDILKNPTLKETLWNPKTQDLLVEGDILKQPKLGEFLKVIGENGIAPFYEGEIAKKLVEEIRSEGGNITVKDFQNYTVQWMKPVYTKWGPYKMYSAPNPGSGEILAFMLHMFQELLPNQNDVNVAQRMTETFKWAYGQRTQLGDISESSFVQNPQYIKDLLAELVSGSSVKEIRKKVKDDTTYDDPEFYGAKFSGQPNHGTCHISVLSENGDAVSLTSSVNLVFGAKFISPSTGILFNDGMADFSSPNIVGPFGLPPSPANFIRPRKRALSSMCPTIFLDENNDVALVVGASGGTRITSTVAYVVYHHLMANMSIDQAIRVPRIHHQLFPMEFDFETGYPTTIVSKLRRIGHKTKETVVTRTSTVTAISKKNKKVTPSFDYRRGGSAASY